MVNRSAWSRKTLLHLPFVITVTILEFASAAAGNGIQILPFCLALVDI